jgi:ABC-type polysaccharide/polyol phosphate export permease
VVECGSAWTIPVHRGIRTTSDIDCPLRYISELSPATCVLRGVRSALIDGTGPDRGEVAILVVMACFFIPVGLWGFGRAERTGKLKRVG